MRAGSGLEVAKELATSESKLTRKEYAESEREMEKEFEKIRLKRAGKIPQEDLKTKGPTGKTHPHTFVFEAMMLLLTRKDQTKDLTSLFPPQHISPPKLYHAPGYIPASELGISESAK